MGSAERSKKRAQLWKKAIVHFSVCFVMGFFTGFAPTAGNKASNSMPLSRVIATRYMETTFPRAAGIGNASRRLVDTPAEPPAFSGIVGEAPRNKKDIMEIEAEMEKSSELVIPRKLLIIVTPTSTSDPFRGVFLRRLAGTIRLVPAPLLWIVVEKQSGSDEVSEILRKTGIMYRHLVVKEDFIEREAELEHQRNAALRHIKHHRLAGIVHFAGLANVYDLEFFQELREIEVFGTWPMAMLSAKRDMVIIEGPVCDSTQVLGWHIKKMNNETATKPPIHISSFAFNSSILWDPERWGRPSSTQGITQDSVKFVKGVVNEDDESSVNGISGEKCSRILVWHLFPTSKLPLLGLDPSQR